MPTQPPTPITGANSSGSSINDLAKQRFNQIITNRVLASILLIAASSLVLSLWVGVRDTTLRLRAGETPIIRSRYSRTVFVTTMGALAGAALAILASPAPDIVYKTF